jgi:hypothetical protein
MYVGRVNGFMSYMKLLQTRHLEGLRVINGLEEIHK